MSSNCVGIPADVPLHNIKHDISSTKLGKSSKKARQRARKRKQRTEGITVHGSSPSITSTSASSPVLVSVTNQQTPTHMKHITSSPPSLPTTNGNPGDVPPGRGWLNEVTPTSEINAKKKSNHENAKNNRTLTKAPGNNDDSDNDSNCGKGSCSSYDAEESDDFDDFDPALKALTYRLPFSHLHS